MSFVRAFAPATVANLGAGFDILGMAVQGPGDRVEVALQAKPGVTLLSVEGDDGLLPREPERNTATVAAAAVLRLAGADAGVEVRLHKGLPLNSGLGSSAASAVAAALATNACLGEPLQRAQLLPACLEGEAAVSGWHADNVAPALLGGICLIAGTEVGQIRQLPVPPELLLALVTPAVDVPTKLAREVLPQQISLKQMVAQTASVARLVAALFEGDLPALATAMEADGVVEPARASLMPLLDEARSAAKVAGALGLVISGAGPTLCAVCDGEPVAQAVVSALGALYESAGMDCVARVSRVDSAGARLL